MRILTVLSLTLAVLQGASAACNCPDIAARASNCDPQDSTCVCAATSYLTALISCSRFRRDENCSDQDLADATDDYNNLCRSLTTTSADSTPTSSLTEDSQFTTTLDPASTTVSTTRRISSSRTTSTTATRTPTNMAAASNSQPVLTTAQIGGIAGGGAGFLIILTLFLVLFCTHRKYKKRDKKEEAERGVEAEKFVEGGRQMRAASMVPISDRLYSTQRPLSYALGEYDSSRYDGGEHREGVPESTPPDSLHGNYFSRFSGSHVEDSAQAFANNPRGSYHPPSSYQNSRRSISVNTHSPDRPKPPTASLSYEEYRNPHTDPVEEQSSLIGSPHRSVSAPQRFSRKPVGNSVHGSERTADSQRTSSESSRLQNSSPDSTVPFNLPYYAHQRPR
ncbi:hypothetical protein DRE_02207 [Drechslerella stenobrocha 248]|uniref:Extracellular membrane protein CFEM domain-containing protein n=1 Tax=Drechslerella stenobrocha 248 TaxID=1043628 RepID=W7I7Y9_9PEZI|nr:hypothetical protein DRE_02207 [Drechslerella stenobrocha 248]